MIGAEAKASLNRAAIVSGGRRETLRSTLGQNEGEVELTGGSNRLTLKSLRMN